MLDQKNTSGGTRDLPGSGKSVSILGVPLSFGQSMAGVDLGPGAIRVAGLAPRIQKLGYSVDEMGDLPLERPRSLPAVGEKLKYLREIHEACERLASAVEKIADADSCRLRLAVIIRSRLAPSPGSLSRFANVMSVWVWFTLTRMPT